MQSGNGNSQENSPGTPNPAFLIMDTESVPDGLLVSRVKYPEENGDPKEAVARAQEEARERSFTNSDFLPVTFQFPVAVCILRVGTDFLPQAITCLDAPSFRPREIVETFWRGMEKTKEKYGERVKLVTFNGRGFDLPLLELAAFRYGCTLSKYFYSSRQRFGGLANIDLKEVMTNYNAFRFTGGLNLLCKLLGLPGKMDVTGDQVYGLYLEGRLQEINDYCLFDTLDTYFVFLRTRVMLGEFSLEREREIIEEVRTWLENQEAQFPAVRQYLDNWGEWNPWP